MQYVGDGPRRLPLRRLLAPRAPALADRACSGRAAHRVFLAVLNRRRLWSADTNADFSHPYQKPAVRGHGGVAQNQNYVGDRLMFDPRVGPVNAT